MRAYLGVAIVGLLALAAVGSSLRFFTVAYYHLKAPHDICFESHNLASIKSIQAGANIYEERFFAEWPFIITIYNPLFHYLVAALPESSSNPFLVGRLVSLISTLLTATLLLLPGGVKRNFIYAFFFIVSFFLLRLMVMHAAYLRCDTLGMFFSGAAVVLLDKTYFRKAFLIPVAGLCFLAFASKQSSIVASVACCLFLLWKSREAGILFIMVLGSMYGIFAAFAQSYWGSGYWFSAYIALMKTPASPIRALLMWKGMLEEPLLVLLSIVTGLTILHEIHKGKSRFIKESPYPLFLVFSLIFCTISASKLGSSENCLLEAVLAALLWNVYSLKDLGEKYQGNLVRAGALTIFLITVCIELLFAKPNLYSFADEGTIAIRESAYDTARSEINELNPPTDRYVCLNSLSTLYKIQSGAYLNDPFNYWMMWEHGILSVSPFVQALEQKRFSLVLIVSPENPYGVPAMPSFPATPALKSINHTLNENYVLCKKGVFVYFAPRPSGSN